MEEENEKEEEEEEKYDRRSGEKIWNRRNLGIRITRGGRGRVSEKEEGKVAKILRLPVLSYLKKQQCHFSLVSNERSFKQHS